MRIGIAIDDWKLKTYTEHLKAAGFEVTSGPGITQGTLMLYVVTDNPDALYEAIRGAMRLGPQVTVASTDNLH